MSKITKEQILLPGVDLEELGRIDLTTSEVEELIKQTQEKQVAIIALLTTDPSTWDKTMFAAIA